MNRYQRGHLSSSPIFWKWRSQGFKNLVVLALARELVEKSAILDRILSYRSEETEISERGLCWEKEEIYEKWGVTRGRCGFILSGKLESAGDYFGWRNYDVWNARFQLMFLVSENSRLRRLLTPIFSGYDKMAITFPEHHTLLVHAINLIS